MRECRECFYPVTAGLNRCPKCDADLRQQTDGSIAQIDIAHHKETVEQAIRKLDRAVAHHRHQLTHSLRVVVGRGKIGQAATRHLRQLQACGEIVRFALEPKNPGAIVVQLKRGRRR